MAETDIIFEYEFRDATKEEKQSVDEYIKSISTELFTFTADELKEHDDLISAAAIRKFVTKLIDRYYKEEPFGLSIEEIINKTL